MSASHNIHHIFQFQYVKEHSGDKNSAGDLVWQGEHSWGEKNFHSNPRSYLTSCSSGYSPAARRGHWSLGHQSGQGGGVKYRSVTFPGPVCTTIIHNKNLFLLLGERCSSAPRPAESNGCWGRGVQRSSSKSNKIQKFYLTEIKVWRKVIAAEGEQKASRALKEASDIITESAAALQLRQFLQWIGIQSCSFFSGTFRHWLKYLLRRTPPSSFLFLWVNIYLGFYRGIFLLVQLFLNVLHISRPDARFHG